jgi:hypothetical protein
MKCFTMRLLLSLATVLPIATGCGSQTTTPTPTETKKADETKTLKKLDSADEKEQIEGAREAAKQFGEPKKEETK